MVVWFYTHIEEHKEMVLTTLQKNNIALRLL